MDDAGEAGRHGHQPDRRGEAEMVAIAFTGNRQMRSRLRDHSGLPVTVSRSQPIRCGVVKRGCGETR